MDMISVNTIWTKICLALTLLHTHLYAKDVEVYTEFLPPFQLMLANQVTGSATVQVKQILENAQLPYHIQMVPWARAYNIVKSTPNTFIYSINRTPEREPYFHWITVVGEISNGFIALASEHTHVSKLEDIKHNVTAVVRNGYAHELLQENGFTPDKNLYVVSTLEQQIRLLLKGKIKYIFSNLPSVQHALLKLQLEPSLVRVIYTEASWTRDLYLATNLNTDPDILRQIKNVSAESLP